VSTRPEWYLDVKMANSQQLNTKIESAYWHLQHSGPPWGYCTEKSSMSRRPDASRTLLLRRNV